MKRKRRTYKLKTRGIKRGRGRPPYIKKNIYIYYIYIIYIYIIYIYNIYIFWMRQKTKRQRCFWETIKNFCSTDFRPITNMRRKIIT